MNIVKRLRELGYVDDTKYANSILDYYKSSKGKNYIVNKLKEKMVDKDIIEEVAKNYIADEEEEVAFKITSKIYLQYRKYPISKQRILITQKLIRDGFSVASASKALEKIELVDESVDNLKKDYLKLLKKYDKNDKTCKQKIIASLYKKGYNYSSIIKLVGEDDE